MVLGTCRAIHKNELHCHNFILWGRNTPSDEKNVIVETFLSLSIFKVTVTVQGLTYGDNFTTYYLTCRNVHSDDEMCCI